MSYLTEGSGPAAPRRGGGVKGVKVLLLELAEPFLGEVVLFFGSCFLEVVLFGIFLEVVFWGAVVVGSCLLFFWEVIMVCGVILFGFWKGLD